MANLEDILGTVPVVAGYPRPDWRAVADWIATHEDEPNHHSTYTDLGREWLVRLRSALGDGYGVFESENFIFLGHAEREKASRWGRLAEMALQELLEGMPGIAIPNRRGKLPVLCLYGVETYYDYVSYFYPDGEYGGSAGVYVLEGHPHIVLKQTDAYWFESVIVHEITHACLEGRDLPVWVEEGVTQLVEEAVVPVRGFQLNRETFKRHRQYWTDNGLRCFWYGESFQRPDDGQELSYHLAEVLTRNLLSRGREAFLRFIQQADPMDCGDEAAHDVYGFGVADLATQFLGPGDWNCEPMTTQELYFRALDRQERGAFRNARDDFELALKLNPEDPENLNSYAWLLSTCPDDEVRNGEKAVTLATRAAELTDWKSEPIVDTLAAAYAESGDFEQAVRWARAAVELADDDALGEDEARLRLYEEKKPYRDR